MERMAPLPMEVPGFPALERNWVDGTAEHPDIICQYEILLAGVGR
jgi:hypothetical protein